MDAQKVDAFIMANGKFFPDYQVAAIRDMLLAADDSKWSMLQVMQYHLLDYLSVCRFVGY